MVLKRIYKEPPVLIVFGLFILYLVSFSTGTSLNRETENLLPIVVPYINIDSTLLLYITFLVSIFLCFIGLFQGLRQDPFVRFLGIRIFLFAPIQVLVLFLQGDGIRTGNYFIYLLEFTFYLAILSTVRLDNIRGFKIIFKIVVLIISLETIYQAFVGVFPQVPYINPWYKTNLIIPVGSTNTLACLILPVLAAEYGREGKKNFKQCIFLATCAFAILLTKSRFGMGMMLAVYMYLNKNKKSGRFTFVLFVLSMIAIIYLLVINWEMVSIVLYGFSDEVNGNTAEKLSSGRMSYFSSYLYATLESPLWGNGPNYEESRAHNIIIDTLFQVGILGFMLFVSCLRNVLKHHRILIKNKDYKYFFTIVVISLIMSLGEITFFTDIVCDLMFFTSLSVLSVLKSKYIKNSYPN